MYRMRNNRQVAYAKHTMLRMRYMTCLACGAFKIRMRHIHMYRMRNSLVSHTLHMCRMRNNRHVVYAKHSTLHMRYMACVACGAFNVRMRHIHMYRMRNSMRLTCDALCTACDTKLCVGENKKWYIKNIFLKKKLYIYLVDLLCGHTYGYKCSVYGSAYDTLLPRIRSQACSACVTFNRYINVHFCTDV